MYHTLAPTQVSPPVTSKRGCTFAVCLPSTIGAVNGLLASSGLKVTFVLNTFDVLILTIGITDGVKSLGIIFNFLLG